MLQPDLTGVLLGGGSAAGQASIVSVLQQPTGLLVVQELEEAAPLLSPTPGPPPHCNAQ